MFDTVCENVSHQAAPADATWAQLRRRMGPSRVVRALIDAARPVAPTDLTVLITGETGSGKELLANALHAGSARAEGPFVAVDCGAVTPSLAESMLFGHEPGAFTGAIARRIGEFERAHGGTLFLDEVANLPPEVQCKLLRAIETRRVRRVGGAEESVVSIRVIAACNGSLLGRTGEGGFRQDLFYRLNEYPVEVPALRDRREDIPYLARRFVREVCRQRERVMQTIAAQSDRALVDAAWPGNVRQLRNVMRRASVRAGDTIEPAHLDLGAEGWEPSGIAEAPEVYQTAGASLEAQMITAEQHIISQCLSTTNGNKAEAARRLDIDYRTLHRKLRRHGMNIT